MTRVWLLFFFVIGIFLSGLYYPLVYGKHVVNGDHLVAFYEPWASEKGKGWGVSVPQKPIGDDDLRIFYPQRTFTMKAIQTYKEIPFWNPLSFAGNDHAGLSETAVFYPLNLLFFFVPQILGFDLLILLEPLIAACGMMAFLLCLVKQPKAAVVGSVSFAFSSLLMVRAVEGLSVGHSLIWLPWVFWSIVSFDRTGKLRYLFVLTASLLCSLTAGWFQYTFLVGMFGLAYAIWLARISKRWGSLIPFFILPLITLFHTIPVVAAFFQSPRGLSENHVAQLVSLLPLRHLIAVLFVDYWGNPATFSFIGPVPYKEILVSVGSIALILSVATLFEKRRDPIVSFFWIAAVTPFFVIIDSPVSRFLVSLPIPVVSTFLPPRLFLVTVFSLSVLAARGASTVFSRDQKNAVTAAFVVTGVSLLCALYLWRFGTASMTRNTILPIAVSVGFLVSLLVFRGKLRFLLVGAIIVGIGVSVLYTGKKYMAFSPASRVYPNASVLSALSSMIGRYRYVSIGSTHIPTNMPLQFGIPSLEGVGSMYSARYGELLSYVTTRSHTIDSVLRVEAYLQPPEASICGGLDPLMQRFLSIAGARYLVGTGTCDSDRYVPVWTSDSWKIWEDSEGMPRAFFTGDFSVKSSPYDILPDMFDSDNALTHIVVEKAPSFSNNTQASGSATIVSSTANTITIDAVNDSPGFVFLSDVYSPSFRATVDGKPTSIFRANYAFRAVPVGKGQHRIVMYYDTTPWVIGTTVSVSIFLVLVCLSVILVKKRVVIW